MRHRGEVCSLRLTCTFIWFSSIVHSSLFNLVDSNKTDISFSGATSCAVVKLISVTADTRKLARFKIKGQRLKFRVES